MNAKHASINFKEKYRQCCLTAACIAAACLTLMAAPHVNYSKDNGSIFSGIALSIITWALVLAVAVSVQRLWFFAQHCAEKDSSPDGLRFRTAKIGLLTLATNPEGIAAEFVLTAGILLWLLRAFGVVYLADSLRMLQYCLTFAGLLLHCFFNGRHYIYIKSKSKRENRGKEK